MNEADDIPADAPFAQVGALPYRLRKDGAVEVLLIPRATPAAGSFPRAGA